MTTSEVVLVGKPGCHLCEDAAGIVEQVCAELGVPWREQSVLDDPVLMDQYAETIPVVLINGRQHDFLRIDADRLRAALTNQG